MAAIAAPHSYQLDDYYLWFYGWGKVPADTYKADIALLAWLHAELAWKVRKSEGEK